MLRIEERGIFIICLVLSLVVWTMSKLSQPYTTEIPVAVRYQNLPNDKALMQSLPDSVFLMVKATGMSLFRQTYFSTQSVMIDYAKYSDKGRRINMGKMNKQFEDQLSGFVILDIKPDTIYFNFDKHAAKKVPIYIQNNISTLKHFELKKVSAYSPDSVEVSGPASFIDTLRQWATVPLYMKDQTESTDGDIALQPAPDNHIHLSAQKTRYKIEIEEFTEKTIPINVEIIKLPPHMALFLHPNRVNVRFSVGIDQFDAINETQFQIVANFENVDIAAQKEIKLRCVRYPPHIKNMSIEPSSIEYIIME